MSWLWIIEQRDMWIYGIGWFSDFCFKTLLLGFFFWQTSLVSPFLLLHSQTIFHPFFYDRFWMSQSLSLKRVQWHLRSLKKNVPEKFGFLTPNYSNICLVFSILSRDLSKILDLPIKSGCLLWMTPNLNIFHIEIWFFKPTLALLFKIKLNKWDILHKCHNFQNFFIIFCQRKIPQTWQN